MLVLCFFRQSNNGSNVSSIEVNWETVYTMFFLHGETAIIKGLCILRIVQTLSRSVLVAVAVKAKQYASSGMILHISPIRSNAERNVSPLKIIQYNKYYDLRYLTKLTTSLQCALHLRQMLSV